MPILPGWRLLLFVGPVPVMTNFEAFFDEPLEFSEAVDDCVGLVWMRRGAGEDLVDPRVIPTDTVKKYRGNAGAFSRNNVGRAVADVPAIEPRGCTNVVERLEDRFRIRFAFAGVAAAHGHLEKPNPGAVLD